MKAVDELLQLSTRGGMGRVKCYTRISQSPDCTSNLGQEKKCERCGVSAHQKVRDDGSVLCRLCSNMVTRLDGKPLTEMDLLRIKYWGALYCIDDEIDDEEDE